MSKDLEEEFSIDDMLNEFDDEKIEEVVNSPYHYRQSSLECIDAILSATHEMREGYLQGNIIKYLWRYRYKNGMEDLKKAQWYLNKLIEVYKETHK